jgi:hypothetical protein
MRQFYIITTVFLFFSGVFSVNAQDLLILKDGNTVEATVLEISSTEIRYRRFDNLEGPIIVIPVTNVLSIRYENGTTEIINSVAIAGEKKPPVLEPGKFYFSISADPSGFLLYGPLVLTEFTKNHFNAQVYVSFPSIGLLVEADGFGIGFGTSINYLWLTRLGAFYLGGLFDYGGYSVNIPGLTKMPDGNYTDGKFDYPNDKAWEASYTFALNIGYKFVLSSGIYFNTGANAGVKITDDIRNHDVKFSFFARPSTSVGYSF